MWWLVWICIQRRRWKCQWWESVSERKGFADFPVEGADNCAGGLKNFKSVTEKDFLVGVSYADVVANKSEKLPLTVKRYPDVVSHVRVTPSSVDYLIEQQTVSEPSKEKESE